MFGVGVSGSTTARTRLSSLVLSLSLSLNCSAPRRRAYTYTHSCSSYSSCSSCCCSSVVHHIPNTRLIPSSARLGGKRAFGGDAAASASAEHLSDSGSDAHASAGTSTYTNDSEKEWHLPPPPEHSLSSPLERLKYPARGGRDLAGRYARLERSLRGKEGYERDIEGYDDGVGVRGSSIVGEEKGKEPQSTTKKKGERESKAPRVFAGFTIPEVPKPPEPDECCMSGCAVCVYDLYAEALEAHERALGALRGALRAKGVAEETWPAQIRADVREGEGNVAGRELGKARQATLSAFEQMELQLAARHNQAQTQTQAQTTSVDGGRKGSDDAGAAVDRIEHATEETVALSSSINSNIGSESRTETRRSIQVRGGTRNMNLDAKAVLEALSWVLFSRR